MDKNKKIQSKLLLTFIFAALIANISGYRCYPIFHCLCMDSYCSQKGICVKVVKSSKKLKNISA